MRRLPFGEVRSIAGVVGELFLVGPDEVQCLFKMTLQGEELVLIAPAVGVHDLGKLPVGTLDVMFGTGKRHAQGTQTIRCFQTCPTRNFWEVVRDLD